LKRKEPQKYFKKLLAQIKKSSHLCSPKTTGKFTEGARPEEKTKN
jgi:hypothetical protein